VQLWDCRTSDEYSGVRLAARRSVTGETFSTSAVVGKPAPNHAWIPPLIKLVRVNPKFLLLQT
jgi:hypothetical protein